MTADYRGRRPAVRPANVLHTGVSSLERTTLFAQMHRQLKSQARHPIILDWARRFADSERQLAVQRTLFDRELFYAVQSRERLMGIIETYRAQLDLAT